MLPPVHRLQVPPRTLDIARDKPTNTPKYQTIGEHYDALGRNENKKKPPDRRVDVEVEPGWCWLCCLVCCSESWC